MYNNKGVLGCLGVFRPTQPYPSSFITLLLLIRVYLNTAKTRKDGQGHAKTH